MATKILFPRHTATSPNRVFSTIVFSWAYRASFSEHLINYYIHFVCFPNIAVFLRAAGLLRGVRVRLWQATGFPLGGGRRPPYPSRGGPV